MTLYVLANWFLCILTSVMLISLLVQHRFLFVKPSIIVILFFHLRIQWAATVTSEYIYSYLPDALPFAVLAHGFPLIGLLVSFFSFQKSSLFVWERITSRDYHLPSGSYGAVVVLTASLLVLTAWYLSIVPFSRTGLYAVFMNSEISAQAREDSLKLLDSVFLKYGYTLMTSVIAPLLAVMISLFIAQDYKRRNVPGILLGLAVLAVILISVSLTGARMFAAKIVLSIFFAFFFLKGMRIQPVYIFGAIVVVFAFPVIISIFREGKAINFSLFYQYLTSSIFYRVFADPMFTGLWHVHYAQNIGFIGIGGIPKLAYLFGEAGLNVPNIIGLQYTPTEIRSVSCVTAYIFSYYSYFGMYALPFIFMGLWALDLVVYVYLRISDRLLLPLMASLSVSSFLFLEGDYTTVLITHGFMVLIMTAWFLDILCRIRIPYKKLRPSTI